MLTAPLAAITSGRGLGNDAVAARDRSPSTQTTNPATTTTRHTTSDTSRDERSPRRRPVPPPAAPTHTPSSRRSQPTAVVATSRHRASQPRPETALRDLPASSGASNNDVRCLEPRHICRSACTGRASCCVDGHALLADVGTKGVSQPPIRFEPGLRSAHAHVSRPS